MRGVSVPHFWAEPSDLRVCANMPAFNCIVSETLQSTPLASVICWTGSISYSLSVFWFMYPLHCRTAVLIFYQKPVTGCLLAQHLHYFKSSQATRLHPERYVAVLHFTESLAWLSLQNVIYFIPLVGLEVSQWWGCSNRINQPHNETLHDVGVWQLCCQARSFRFCVVGNQKCSNNNNKISKIR